MHFQLLVLYRPLVLEAAVAGVALRILLPPQLPEEGLLGHGQQVAEDALDADAIAAFLSRGGDSLRVLVSTYNSLGKVGAETPDAEFAPRLGGVMLELAAASRADVWKRLSK